MGTISAESWETTWKDISTHQKATMAKEPEWTLKLEVWGTNKEIEDPEYAHKKKRTATRNSTQRADNETETEAPSEGRDNISMERRGEIPQKQ